MGMGWDGMVKIATTPQLWKKPFESNLLRIERPMTIKLVMQHRGIRPYQVCLNDDPSLTLTFLS